MEQEKGDNLEKENEQKQWKEGESNLEKEQESESKPLKENQVEVIQFYNYDKNKNYINKYIKYVFIIGFGILICTVLFALIYLIKFIIQDEKVYIPKYKNEKSNKTKTKKEITKKEITKKEVPSPPKKIGIAFLNPTIEPFMITSGEYFLNLEKYNVYYLTKLTNEKVVYNKKITRINAYNDKKKIEKTVKEENLNYIIVSETCSVAEVTWLKSLGLKVIGVFKDVYNGKKEVHENFELFDAFIQDSVNDFDKFKKLKISRNIFIPHIYDSLKIKQLPLTNQNILLLGKINDEKIVSVFNAFSSVLKEFPLAHLEIISSEIQSPKTNLLIKQLGLSKNIKFLPFDSSISNYCKDASIFLYTSFIEDCPLALNEAMSYGLPCIISSDLSEKTPLKEGLININIFNDKSLSIEITKLLKDTIYRKKIGANAKYSLEKFNKEIVKLWERLFNCLKNGEKEFQILRKEIRIHYTKREIPIAIETKVNKEKITKKSKVIGKESKTKVRKNRKKRKARN